MIDYLVTIMRETDGNRCDALRSTLAARLVGWEEVRVHPNVLAYVRVRSESRFTVRRRPSGCLLGIDLGNDSGAWGAYVRIDWTDEGRVTIARDPTGLIPCWRTSAFGAEVVFSDLSEAARALDLSPEIDWDFVRYHLNAPHSQGSRTGVNGVTELLPGWRMEVGDGDRREAPIWGPAAVSRFPFTTTDDALRAMRTAGETAVGAWGRQYQPIALTVSGGLDSAIVLGLLRRYAPDTEVIAVNYLVSHAEGDERAYAVAATPMHGVPLQVFDISSEGLVFDLDEGRGRLRPTTYVLPLGYRQARERIASEIAPEAIFSGTGGDHLFHESMSPRVLTDAMMDGRSWANLLAIAHQVAPLARETFWSMLWEAHRTRRAGAPMASSLVMTPNAFLTADAASGIDWTSLMHPDVSVEGLGPAKTGQIVSQLDLQNHYWRYGQAFGSDEVHPLISQPMLETSLRTPTYWFGHGGVQRGLARAAFADLLPDSIRLRRGKGSNTSHWIAVMTQNLPFLRELMLDGELVQRGYVDRQAMETALTPLALAGKTDFAGFTTCIGTEIWVRQALSGLSRAPASITQAA